MFVPALFCSQRVSEFASRLWSSERATYRELVIGHSHIDLFKDLLEGIKLLRVQILRCELVLLLETRTSLIVGTRTNVVDTSAVTT
jgi:hypothetical protein